MDILSALQVLFGIGLVIFVHELGHHLAARFCKVRVETFSLGFGPRLVGKRVGDTMYQIAAVPLGGYCRMAGEDRRWQGLEPRPDEIGAKSVGARFFIYSAGVLMNLLFVLVVFPILFSVGVPFKEARVGSVLEGGPAWMAGVPEQSEVLSVNGEEIFEFEQIRTEVTVGGDEVELVVRTPGATEPTTFLLEREPDPQFGIPRIGIGPAMVRDDAGHLVLTVQPGSPAEAAGLVDGDRLVRVFGYEDFGSTRVQFERASVAGEEMRLEILSGDASRTVTVEPELQPSEIRRVGITALQNLVLAVRPGSPADVLGLQAGDQLASVNGRALFRANTLRAHLLAAPGPVQLVVERAGSSRTLEREPFAPEELDRFLDGLALRADMDGTRIAVEPGGAAWDAGLRDGDRVLQVSGTEVSEWNGILRSVRHEAGAGTPIAFAVERRTPEGGSELLTLTAEAREIPLPVYGLGLRYAQYTYQAASLGEALRFGFYSSWKLVQQLWFALKGIVVGDLPVRENVGGPILIAQVSYTVAQGSWAEFFFFLCFISMNLAVLNILPIPVLDGGHLFFLIIEKIKGSPVSEKVLGYSQMVGVVVILSLVVYVTYNDFMRLLGTP